MNHSHKWAVLVSMCLVMMMLSIDASAVNIAIPVIAHDFYASLTDMQWVINAFFLLCAMVQIIGGHMGDSYGHKKFFSINLSLFILASLGVALSRNEYWMIGFRALQGATIGIAYPSTWVLLYAAFPKDQIGFASSFFVATMGIFLALGTPLGGFFVHTIGWPWIFYINVPIGLLSLLLAWKYCRPDEKPTRKPIDLKGGALLVLSLFGLAFGLNQVQNWGFLSFSFLGCMILGLLFLYLLYRNERHAESRLVDFHFFKIRNYAIHSAIRIVIQLVFLTILFAFPLYLQNVIGDSAFMSGCILLIMTVVMAAISPVAGKWVDRAGDKITILFSLSLFLLLAILMLFIQSTPNYWLLGAILLLAGISIGVAYISSQTGVRLVVPETKQAPAMAVYLTIAWLACSLGVSTSGTSIALGSQEFLASHHPVMRNNEDLLQRASRGLSPSASLNPQLQDTAKNAFASGLHVNAWVLIIVSAAGIGLASALKKKNL